MNSSTPWWSSFFTGLSASVVSRIANPAQTEQEAKFIAKLLQLQPAATIGDVPCGNGRLLIELAKQGFQTRGIDISQELITAAKSSASDAGVSVEVHVGDMKELEWSNELDGAYCFGNSFAYFEDEGNLQFLSAVYGALKSNARFILQTNVIAESILTKPLSRTWYELGDILFLHSARYEPENSALISDYRLSRGRQIERKSAVYRIYTVREIFALLREIGFRNLRAIGNFNEEPFKLGDPSLYIVAQK